jgi:uncharacterized protein
MWDSDLLLPLYGFVVGLLVGLTGMGGGVIMTPLLMLGLGLPPATAVGTDLAYATITKLAGTWQHWRQGTVDRAVVRGLALGSLPASLLAVAVLAWLRRTGEDRADAWLERAIGVALLVAALLMLNRIVRGHTHANALATVRHQGLKLAAIGALGGFMVGLTSIGSGSLILALLVLVAPLRPELLVGTDVAHATLLVGTAAVAHLIAGDVDPAVVGWLVLGSVPGILIGSRLLLTVPRRPLQIGLAGLLLSTAVPLLR